METRVLKQMLMKQMCLKCVRVSSSMPIRKTTPSLSRSPLQNTQEQKHHEKGTHKIQIMTLCPSKYLVLSQLILKYCKFNSTEYGDMKLRICPCFIWKFTAGKKQLMLILILVDMKLNHQIMYLKSNDEGSKVLNQF